MSQSPSCLSERQTFGQKLREKTNEFAKSIEKNMEKSFLASEYPQSMYITLIVECAHLISLCHMEAFSMFNVVSNRHGTAKLARR